MKTRYLIAVFAFAFMPVLLFGQDVLPAPVVDDELMTKPFQEWQLNLTTVMLATMILGRVIAAIKKGGGLKGILNGIWGGTNTPES